MFESEAFSSYVSGFNREKIQSKLFTTIENGSIVKK